ncbi:MAG: inorganic diphosphatase [Microcoleaceae cyanobacterium MO_207.B10]|nr:inorganic diphosphatase [Microcoleaceae cyanobacterium MO_207.B10]
MKKSSIASTSLLITGLLMTINYNTNINNVIALEPENNTSTLKAEVISPGMRAEDEYTIISPKNLLSGYEPKNPDGTINMVLEIPTGTLAKWEVTKPDGKPRVVQYLGYPGNYGMIQNHFYRKNWVVMATPWMW